MRTALAAALLAALFSTAATAAKKKGTPAGRAAQKVASLAVYESECARATAEPQGLCAPYDREHCRFEDGSLHREDLRDPRAPFTLRPISGKAGLYCRYDGAMRLQGVERVDDPAQQKARWDATKLRRRRH